jgi:hypothetical protein
MEGGTKGLATAEVAFFGEEGTEVGSPVGA